MDKFLIKLPKNLPQPCSSTSVSESSTSTSEQQQKNENVEENASVRSQGSGKMRTFQKHWKNTFQWIDYKNNKVFCLVCTAAWEKKLLIFPSNQGEKNSVKTFVERGFDNWKKALKTFSAHEKSQVHRSAAVANASVDKGVNVLATLSQNKLKEMKNARQALLKILSSLQFLSQQGLAIRGHTDETSNIRQLLLLRSEDVPELKIWLQRSKFKWLSHDILNELLSLLAFEVLNNLLLDIRSAQFFSIIIDETTDLSTKEQVSVCFRYVNASFEIEETFLGFYETPSTTASSLFTIVQDVLLRFNLNIENCRGQCYDGAANVSGTITGLQSRIKELEPRAIYVHCAAHTLNLVVQDSMQNITEVRDFLVVIRDLISFVKGSPKRLAAFTNIQQTSGNEGEMQTSSLRPLCPTRWCLRIKSLQTVEKNFIHYYCFSMNYLTIAVKLEEKPVGF